MWRIIANRENFIRDISTDWDAYTDFWKMLKYSVSEKDVYEKSCDREMPTNRRYPWRPNLTAYLGKATVALGQSKHEYVCRAEATTEFDYEMDSTVDGGDFYFLHSMAPQFVKGGFMVGVILALIVTAITGYLIVTKAKPQVTLLAAGLVLMVLGSLLGEGTIMPEGKGSGFLILDMFGKIKDIFSSRAGGLGLSIMAVGGYAKYMDLMGASRAMVHLLSHPLKMIKSPYIVLSCTYVIGEIMAQFITSASGLGMLLMVSLFPTLICTGVSRLSAVAVIGTTMAVEWGIMETNSIFAAEVAGMPISAYYAQFQVPVGCIVVLSIAVAHFFVQRYFDQRMEKEADYEVQQEAVEMPPLYYAILPVMPLLLLLGFLFGADKEVNLVIIMLISVAITVIFQILHSRNLYASFEEVNAFFQGMGLQFANVITLIVAGETFAHGLVTIGAVSKAIHAAESTGFGGVGVMIMMVIVIASCAIVMGSGNAPFFSFANLIPDVAGKLGISAALMVLPMHFATSIARGMSPITAVIVVTSGIAGVSPFQVIKRTCIPLLVGLVVNVAASIILFY